jgi:phosphomevalonate kinase
VKFRAPGKVVLWGEYAVLAGAPAAVMGVNRYAEVTLAPADTMTHCTSRGLLTPGVHKADLGFCGIPTSAMAEAVLRHWGHQQFPRHFTLYSDTSAFFSSDSRKLGIGSSAALCTATYAAFAALLDQASSAAEAIEIHRRFQNGKGSGLDVAAAWHGGVIRFAHGQGEPWQWPGHLYWQVVWTGASAATAASIGDFNQWLATADRGPLADLVTLCSMLFERTELVLLAEYTHALRALDDAAGLNIFTPEHRRLATIAAAHSLVYKPCGAGGGDIGLACSKDPDALAAFTAAVRAEHFVPLDLEIASHGVRAG